MAKLLDIYVVPTQGGRAVLFSPPEVLASVEVESTDHLKTFIDWFTRRPNRVLAWIGRGIRSAHEYYEKLEDKIDPVERVLKVMASTRQYVVYTQNPAEFKRALKRQRWKHVFWFSIDFVITGVVIMFTPFLAPIPGPNL